MNQGIFTLPAVDGEGHTLVFAPSRKGKSMMPDNSELTMDLATKAFEILGREEFRVSAELSVDAPESLRNFGLLQSILLMAYKQGAMDVQEGKVQVVYAGSDPSQFAQVSPGEAEAVLANANIKIVIPANG